MDCKDCIHYAVCWRVKEVETGNPMFTHHICRKFEASTINNIPAEGVQPVKHGKWILTGDEQLDNIYFGNKCSECGFIYCGDFFNYCPECGAKMDRSEENDD